MISVENSRSKVWAGAYPSSVFMPMAVFLPKSIVSSHRSWLDQCWRWLPGHTWFRLTVQPMATDCTSTVNCLLRCWAGHFIRPVVLKTLSLLDTDWVVLEAVLIPVCWKIHFKETSTNFEFIVGNYRRMTSVFSLGRRRFHWTRFLSFLVKCFSRIRCDRSLYLINVTTHFSSIPTPFRTVR